MNSALKSNYIRVLSFLFLLVFLGPAFSAEPNPHKQLSCNDCHTDQVNKPAPIEESNHFTTSIKNDVCINCHQPQSNLHPLGVKSPSSFFPADQQGKITCQSCHFLHAQTTEHSLLRGFASERFGNLKDFCSECHGLEIYKKNPHQYSNQKDRCSFCHFSLSNTNNDSGIRRFCEFCHSKNIHPNSIKDDNRKNCVTCHDPHGANETILYLRKEFALDQPPEKNPHYDKDSCNKCHLNQPSDKQSVNFLYEGNMVVLCTSCHWYKEFMHPVGVTLPKHLKTPKGLPLSKEKKITCVTCHQTCANQKTKKPSLLRLKPIYKQRNDLCFECHNKKEYEFVSPHRNQFDKKKCLYCHDKDLILYSNIVATRKKILKTTESLVCIRCHEGDDPPGFDTHKTHTNVKPIRLVAPASFPLDNLGRITCSSCHEPHLWKGEPLRGDLPKDRFCLNCHLEL